MRPLRLAARRADVHPRRLDAVLRAALVAAGLGGFLLRNCHAAAQCTYRMGRRAKPAGRRKSSLPIPKAAGQSPPAGENRAYLSPRPPGKARPPAKVEQA